MRYSIRAVSEMNDKNLITDLHIHKAENIRTAKRLKMSFAEMSPAEADKLAAKGYIVASVKKTGTHEALAAQQIKEMQAVNMGGKVKVPTDHIVQNPYTDDLDLGTDDFEVDVQQSISVAPPTPVPAIPTYTPADIDTAISLDILKESAVPALSGLGVTVAVVDTGLRSSHNLLQGRVIHSVNFSESPDGDGFGHGTGVASIIVAVSPFVQIIDVKVLADDGLGTEEESVMGLDYLITLYEQESPYAPDIINMSIGAPEDNDPDNILRIAVREAINTGIWIFVAAGNLGPGGSTILSPGVEEYAISVGSCSIRSLEVSDFSSRGPTDAGLTKPDCMLFGENIIVASNASDTRTIAKSGTSFSCPFVTGIFALVNEYYYRQLVNDPEAAMDITNITLLNEVLPVVCGKPEGVTEIKDNTYGLGILLPELAAEHVLGVDTGISTDLGGIIEPMMTMMMMSMMMNSVGDLGGMGAG